MTAAAEFAYSQARLQARHGQRADTALWRQLDASRSAAAFVAQARSSVLARFTEGLAELREPHAIEQGLRSHWRREVREVAGWLPQRWQAAVLAFGRLPELALAAAPQADAAMAWRAEWQDLAPHEEPVRRDCLHAAQLLLPGLQGQGRLRDAAASDERLALLRLFRNRPATAAAACAHLALQALDLERLRGGWIRRLLFEPPAAGAT